VPGIQVQHVLLQVVSDVCHCPSVPGLNLVAKGWWPSVQHPLQGEQSLGLQGPL